MKKKSPYERLTTLPVEDVVERIGLPPFRHTMTVKKHELGLYSLRMRTFKQSGTTCLDCGLQAEFFAVERHINGDTDKYHLNLYGLRDGREVMLTCDHVIARANNGANDLSNTQTLCITCNSRKANK